MTTVSMRTRMILSVLAVLAFGAAGAWGAGGAAWAWAGTKANDVVVVGDTVVITGPRFETKALAEVKDLKFYTCKRADNGQACTGIAGVVISHAGTEKMTVVLDFEFYQIHGAPAPGCRSRGKAHVVIECPAPNKATPFTGIGPEWLTPQLKADPWEMQYTLSITGEGYREKSGQK